MKISRHLFLTALLLFAVAATASPEKVLGHAEISQIVAEALEENHYSRHPVDAELSRRFLEDYIEELDSDHLFFTKTDVDDILSTHEEVFAREIKDGRMGGAWSIYDLYLERVNARIRKIQEFLKSNTFDFNSDRTVEIDRGHSPWPADNAEGDRLWRDQIEGEVLDEKLNGSPAAECVQTVQERYEQLRKELNQRERQDVLAIVLSALARAYDPHSEYLTKTDLEDLDSDMRLSMVGIGVVLQPEGRYVKIVGLLPDGPAARDGRLKVNDRIVAVAHGSSDFVDIVGMSFDRILEQLRAKKGTQVRLKVIAPRGADPSRRKEINLVCRKIELTGDEAKAEVIERTDGDGRSERLGWIKLPSFYGEPDHPEDRSSTRDVRNLLIQLKRQQISGLVVDLRDNPGGELDEAVDTGGLFLGQVPIVQEKDSKGKVYISKAETKKIYDGPMVVVTNHLTASAAELFASALKDYHRAVIVGGNFPTYGKGSIQTVVELDDIIPKEWKSKGEELGALDLTIGKFYRVNGSSTQLHGLDADLHLPSPEDVTDEGESALKNPLAYDETKPITTKSAPYFLPVSELKQLSAKRISDDPEFRYLTEDLERQKKTAQTNLISLNEQSRRAELDAAKKLQQDRNAERSRKNITLEKVIRLSPDGGWTYGKAGGEEVKKSAESGVPKTDGSKENQPDPVRGEALNILCDLMKLTQPK